jgi:periplasmic divalent cation tolerance protein
VADADATVNRREIRETPRDRTYNRSHATRVADPSMNPVAVLTTVGGGFDAHSLAEQLVEKRLAACVNIFPQVHSVYRWQGRVEHDDEQLLLIKTSDDRLDALEEAVRTLHPYETPEFVVMRIEELRGPYAQWFEAVLRNS